MNRDVVYLYIRDVSIKVLKLLADVSEEDPCCISYLQLRGTISMLPVVPNNSHLRLLDMR
jgi:hypothetical protein